MKDSKSGRLRAGFIKNDNSRSESSGDGEVNDNIKGKGNGNGKGTQQSQTKKTRKKRSRSTGSKVVSGDDIRKEYIEASTSEKDSSELNKVLTESITEEDEKRKQDEQDIEILALALRKLAEENKIKLRK